jgi:hypothetical protein
VASSEGNGSDESVFGLKSFHEKAGPRQVGFAVAFGRRVVLLGALPASVAILPSALFMSDGSLGAS